MGKRIIVIASGETERRALPHLMRPLDAQGHILLEVLIPPRHQAISLTMAEKLVKAAWFARIDDRPDKFVILMDVDGKSPADVLEPFKGLADRLGPNISAAITLAYSQWHLEAWYFADEAGLRAYFKGKSLGSIDSSAPDKIQNPKEHLKHLLGSRVYTSVISEEIAKMIDSAKVASRSPSFAAFLQAVRNGLQH